MIKIWKSGNRISSVGDLGKAWNKQIKGYDRLVFVTYDHYETFHEIV